MNRNWQPKVTAVSELRDLSSMFLTTLFGKLQERELELNRLIESEESDKKNKGLALKANMNETIKEDSDYGEFEGLDEGDENMSLTVRKFKRFLRNKGKARQNFTLQKKAKGESTSYVPTCFNCKKKDHIRSKCHQIQKKNDKMEKRPQGDKKARKAYIAWEDNDMDSSDESNDEEVNLCLMANHEDIDDEVTDDKNFNELSYDDLLVAWKKLRENKLC